MSTDVLPTTRPAGASAGKPRTYTLRARRPYGLWIASAWVLLLVGCAVAADVLPLADPAKPVGRARQVPFHSLAPDQILGTDTYGRSVLSRVIFGARTDLLVTLCACAFGAVLGCLLGLLAGFVKGWADRAVSFLIDTLLALPPIILLIAIATILRPSTWTLTFGLTLLTVPAFARLERGAALSWAERPFVLAARSYGASGLRIAFRQILPNSLLTVITFVPTVIAGLIVAEGSLGFLGLGIPPPAASWGTMIADGRASLRIAPHEVLVPAAVVFLTVLALNTLGEKVRDRLEIRSRTG
ncbi:ABC transporter permease [Frankia sp. CNm7]|uniref:ABC transporter permease n=1 Tax=Frankia nepalensis TaxID=1836974 RepID=A0A937USR2_9ACTN|nr:ABC transporter permease [Frankia nepalensis]MBL7502688.1 ABC transporter permease [Frankia nepalensis]MBL7515029.1 ABC transporter permease [Frankia nepalensis]MBL7518722.1 ABC transporter permease [Frankia nepalensis]MBL7629161.1 ABC transporter permease [Frankia nepalensis]